MVMRWVLRNEGVREAAPVSQSSRSRLVDAAASAVGGGTCRFTGLCVCGAEGHLDLKSAIEVGTCGNFGAVGLGDCPHNGQAKPVSVRTPDTLAASFSKRLEESFDLSGRDDRTGVVH
jgi:hypothetical protein